MNDENLDTDPPDNDPVDPAVLDAQSEAGVEESGAGKKTLGLERWVQLGFAVTALLLVWLSGHVISTVWYIFADPSEPVVTAASVIFGIGTAVVLYRSPSVYALSTEVADELSKVTWPTRQETTNSTVVVIVTSIIAAVFLGFFDAIWSAVTDLVYKV
jgi:preprotein translocase SecE subunit